MTLTNTIKHFVTIAIQHGGWTELDRIYLENRVLALIGLDTLSEDEALAETNATAIELVDDLVAAAPHAQTANEMELLASQLMDLITPPPSVINAFFAKYYDKEPKLATDYFYELSKINDYIKTRDIAKNVEFHTPTDYGDLEITINLSKPEKDPKQIAAEKNAPAGGYPKCLLCMENEGYRGRINHPARSNHRIIRLNLDNQAWGLQYSPYAYYNEHCIFLSDEHRPMKIDRQLFENLLRIVEIFPHYFVGSNADLPIVGGSILSHDHYQGGRHEFPMAKAPLIKTFDLLGFPTVKAGIVKWPMSVIRLESNNKQDLVRSAEFILAAWKQYSAPSLDIIAFSEDGTPHHTVTPIARMKEQVYQLDLVLRDNNVSEEHPDGIFHPHKELHHIKKENIGLIEVMGLAILPPRLKHELDEVKAYLLDDQQPIADYHRTWAEKLKATEEITEKNVSNIVEQGVGKVFLKVLEDAGVFKQTETGLAGFERFIQTLS
ncbi:UDP-glucose--hexose-1-phosphate uridylyltransferase [Vagococcus zengguangii]|uniref:Galactose-1-phosphate uridylyltransferase n=1 Tax=Vagococcus zengguangii TaxID=2571750 RepID=A0A4D7CTP8_9ENTE|nr:UDP-glucose--hexose-1-phosphate uridylyltransferase [Vagococcus zengguangii]QCI85760.1 UDP-glucose--hexose-1-phosphate uridylyltransferase [Vagococcus zengguangii]TLG81701.1 UDP-glucose--hexose-1-phosphate uridylyltransferase [Vagococcus zengguangii]